MNEKIVFGQYINKDSWVHRLDPRTKIIVLFLLMICVFVIKNVYVLTGALVFVYLIVLSTKIPLSKFLNSFKMISSLLLFTALFQIIFNHNGEVLVINDIKLVKTFNLNIVTLLISICLLIVYFLLLKVIKKYRLLLFIFLLFLSFYFQSVINISKTIVEYKIEVRDEATIAALRVLVRIIMLVSLSSLLTLTTKPTSLNNGIEGIFSPFKFMKSAVSILAMMISIALRFIPTLLNESQKILKAQASRGCDFNEGKLKSKVIQLIALLVPMFVISYKKAEDLANAMASRGYIPGNDRTKLNELKYHRNDVLCYVFIILVISLLIINSIGRIL